MCDNGGRARNKGLPKPFGTQIIPLQSLDPRSRDEGFGIFPVEF